MEKGPSRAEHCSFKSVRVTQNSKLQATEKHESIKNVVPSVIKALSGALAWV